MIDDKSRAEGMTLRDIELEQSAMQFTFGVDKHPIIPCTKNFDYQRAQSFRNFIKEDFHYNMYLDGIPAAVQIRDPETGQLTTSY